MTEKVWREAAWWHDPPWNAWKYRPSGLYEEGVLVTPTIILEANTVRQLIISLDEAGWIIPRLDERLREEDLKITHRLLDLLEKRK